MRSVGAVGFASATRPCTHTETLLKIICRYAAITGTITIAVTVTVTVTVTVAVAVAITVAVQ